MPPTSSKISITNAQTLPKNISNIKTPPIYLLRKTQNHPKFVSIRAAAYTFSYLKSIDLFLNDDKTRTIVNLL